IHLRPQSLPPCNSSATKRRESRHQLRKGLAPPMISENARRRLQMRTTSMPSQILRRLLSHHSKNPPEAALVHTHEKPPKWTRSSTNSMSSEPKQPGRERRHYSEAERVLKSGPVQTDCQSL